MEAVLVLVGTWFCRRSMKTRHSMGMADLKTDMVLTGLVVSNSVHSKRYMELIVTCDINTASVIPS